MNLNHRHKIYFVGIGGIGMSALARYFMDMGKSVSGYDKTPSPLTRELEEKGIFIHYEDKLEQIPQEIMKDKDNSLIIYTPAIPKNHSGLSYFLKNNFSVMKRAEVLGHITREKTTIAVAGTHGKTSTSSFITHLMMACGIKCQALLGGITVNYNSNYVTNDHNADLFIVEADEYDRSFLQLSPEYAVITSTDPDHLDIYVRTNELLLAYQQFCDSIHPKGHLSVSETARINKAPHLVSVASYGWNAGQDYSIDRLGVENGIYIFDIVAPGYRIEDIHFHVAGDHNVLNCLAAVSIADKFISDKQQLKNAIEGYRGVKRRFEYLIKTEGLVYVDDYAHHPTEIDNTLSTLRKLYPGRKITGVFQPHLYSRTRDFRDGFANSLSELDRIILLEIYPAREEPIAGVSTQIILDKIKNKDKKIVKKEELVQEIEKDPNTVFVTMGAGDIDRLTMPVCQVLKKRM